MRVSAVVADVALAGFALLLGACAEPQTPADAGVAVAELRGDADAGVGGEPTKLVDHSAPVDAPVVDCEDLDPALHDGQDLWVRVRSWSSTSCGNAQLCPGVHALIGPLSPFPFELMDTKTLRGITGCATCDVSPLRNPALALRSGVLYAHVFADRGGVGVSYPRPPPSPRPSPPEIAYARFGFDHKGMDGREATLEYRCPHNDPDYYDPRCLVIRSKPPLASLFP